MSTTSIATRTFSLENQKDFARLSGDCNPIHIDPEVARRSLFGRPVVHGVHALLWGMEAATASLPSFYLKALTVRFMKPLFLDRTVQAEWTQKDNNLTLTINCGLSTALIATAETSEDVPPSKQILPTDNCLPDECCIDLGQDQLKEGGAGEIPLSLNQALARSLFPILAVSLAREQLAGLITTSRVVGMRCPGLHSIFSSMSLTATQVESRHASYEVIQFDDRFSMTVLKYTCPGLSGTINAFLRPKPSEQPTYGQIKQFVTPNEFSGVKALVIGGSRGLGEVTSKILAAGGAEVRGTFYKGRNDADRITNEIVQNGESISFWQLDVTAPDNGILPIFANGWHPTDVYYYPTPPIFDGEKGKFDPALFSRFTSVYVAGFATLLAALPDGQELVRVLYPSTVAIDEIPEDMGEYAAAKTAGETLCLFFDKIMPMVTFHWPRFPRLDTDQTANLYQIKSKDTVTAVLDEIRVLMQRSLRSAQ